MRMSDFFSALTSRGKSTQLVTLTLALLTCCQPTGDYLLSGLLGVTEGEGHFRLDVGRSPLPICKIIQQINKDVVVLQQRYMTVAVAECHIGPNRADVCMDLARETW